MTVARVEPGVAHGSVTAPPSKSYTHRALVAAHLSDRRYTIDRPLVSDDTRATRNALRPLGSRVHTSARGWVVEPGGAPPRGLGHIDCGESGTTLRFAVALAARQSRAVEFGGRGRLGRRPLVELLDAVTGLGAACERAPGPRTFPLTVRGPIHGGHVQFDASRSSQFASALLLTLPTLRESSTLDLKGSIVSEPYIEATLAVLRRHRVEVERSGRRFEIPGGQSYRGSSFRVPGDASSAAYLWAAAAVTGGSVRVRGIPSEWPQADLAVLELLRRAGAEVRTTADGARVQGPATRPFDVDLTSAPDLYPLMAVVAAAIPGRSRLTGAAHIVHKESDRRAGAARLARAMGAKVAVGAGGLAIRGRARPRPVHLTKLDDHRLVMSAAIGALGAEGRSTIGDASAVAKSFPGFWRALGELREGRRS
jgi:3-phosphoshikimate 1-carboxyvinyltransferase